MTKSFITTLILAGVIGQLLVGLGLAFLASDISDYIPLLWSSTAALPAATWIGSLAGRGVRSHKAACVMAGFTAAFVSVSVTSVWFLIWISRAIDA
jgi:hypothetical protein